MNLQNSFLGRLTERLPLSVRLTIGAAHHDSFLLRLTRRLASELRRLDLGFQYDFGDFDGLSRDFFVQVARAEGIEFNVGFRALHLCRSSRRFRKGGEVTVATKADSGMLTLHHPALLAVRRF